MRLKIILAGAVIVVVFLVAFVPQYVRASRLSGELDRTQQALSSAELRDLAALAFVRASEKNFGLAAATTTQLFNRVRELANQTQDASRKQALESLLTARDKITAELAKGDPGAMSDLDQLFHQVRSATGAPAEP